MNEILFAFSSDNKNTEDAVALQKGLLLGDDSLFSKEFRSLTQLSGVSHLVAASGSNLSLVEKIVTLDGWIESAFFSRWGVPLWILFYYLWTGGSASLWRATLFWGTTWFSKHFLKRPVTLRTQVLVTGLATFFLNPDYLGKIGFILSLSAVLGVYFSRYVKSGENKLRIFSQSGRVRSFAEYFVTAATVVAFVAPWTLWFFGTAQGIGILTTWLLEPILVSATLLALMSELLPLFGAEELRSFTALFVFKPIVAVLLSVVWFSQTSFKSVLEFCFFAGGFVWLCQLLYQQRLWWYLERVKKNWEWGE